MDSAEFSVVIADDAPNIRERLEGLLHDISGVSVVAVACDGDEALAALRDHRPDLVVLDIRMPKRGGFEVLEFMRAHSPNTKAVVCTNYPYPQYRERAAELGAVEFVDKGKDLSTVPSIVRRILNQDGS